MSNDEQKVMEEAERIVDGLGTRNDSGSYVYESRTVVINSIAAALTSARRAPEGRVIDDKGKFPHEGKTNAERIELMEQYVIRVLRDPTLTECQRINGVGQMFWWAAGVAKAEIASALAAKGSAGEGEKRA